MLQDNSSTKDLLTLEKYRNAYLGSIVTNTKYSGTSRETKKIFELQKYIFLAYLSVEFTSG
jgi:hypothetical protein